MLFEDSKIMTTLKEHIATCDERYKNIEKRLTNLETKIDEIHSTIDGFKTFLLKLAFKSAMGIFTLVCGAVFIIKM
jgi:chromosome segregation ATPase